MSSEISRDSRRPKIANEPRTSGRFTLNDQRLWNIANELLTSGRFTLKDLFAAAKEKGIPVTHDDLMRADNNIDRLAICERPAIRRHISDFLNSYLADRKATEVLDPFAGNGVLITGLLTKGIAETGVGVVRVVDCLSTPTLDERVKWIIGDISQIPESEAFDLAVSFPPLDDEIVAETFQVAEDQVRVNDRKNFLIVLKSCFLLEESGEGIFLLPNSFFLKNKPDSVCSALSKFGLQVNAVIVTPEALKPWTSIDLNLVFISRKKTDKLFVARLESDSDPIPILENLSQRRVGRVPELGRLVEPSRFSTWHALVLDEEIREIVAKSGIMRRARALRLSEISEEINLGDRSEDGGFEAKPNSFYLPLIGNSPAVIHLNDLRIKPQNCAQIVLHHESALADYVAGFFNTALGRKVREQLTTGLIPKITKRTLLNSSDAIVLLPFIEVQREVSNTHRSIRDLALQLENYERTLWSRPDEASKIKKEFSSVDPLKKKGIESWMEGLPFPLASILWRYFADIEPFRKNNHLLSFFEALAQFIAGLMLSAFHSDEDFFKRNKAEWFVDSEDYLTLRRGSFGGWVILGERLAKFTRQMLSSDNRNLCLSLYRAEAPDLVEAITTKDLYGTLKIVNKYRNDWKGHGGLITEKEEKSRLDLLEDELTHLREILPDSFDETILLSPGKSEYAEGLYYYTINRLMGSRSTFLQMQVETSIPMEKRETYLLDLRGHKPLEIMPFFRIMPSPKTEKNACYFYNRVEKDKVRWVSYHFEQDHEITQPDEEILEIIRELEGSGAKTQNFTQ